MIAAVAVVVIVCLLIKPVIIPAVKYRAAVSLANEENYDEAISAFEALGDYRDSAEQIENCKAGILANKYDSAVSLANEGKYTEAITEFEALGDYRDSAEQILPCRYNVALAFADEGNYAEAIAEFETLGDYQDSEQKISELKTELLRTAEVGDTVYFGNYEQDDDDSDGKEEIAWRVLAKEGNRILVISNNVLDCKPYTSDYITLFSNISWETCSLRTWLNDTFLNEAFNTEEQAIISSVTVTGNGYYQNGDFYPSNDTTDRVFLLSIDEANQYFASDKERSCEKEWSLRTRYSNGFYNGDRNDFYGYLVNSHGVICNSYGLSDTSVFYNIRPAMWIDLSSL